MELVPEQPQRQRARDQRLRARVHRYRARRQAFVREGEQTRRERPLDQDQVRDGGARRAGI